MRRGAGLSAVTSVAAATSGFFFMSAILDYSSGRDPNSPLEIASVTGLPCNCHRVSLAESAEVCRIVCKVDRRARAHGGRGH